VLNFGIVKARVEVEARLFRQRSGPPAIDMRGGMNDDHGFILAREQGITLGEIGHRIFFENDLTRVWEVRLEPGETLGFHIHRHPYLVVSLEGGANRIETIFGQTIDVDEPSGHTVFINEKRAIHRLTNTSGVLYLSRLVEFKSEIWIYDGERK
jgi:hypothetical protein